MKKLEKIIKDIYIISFLVYLLLNNILSYTLLQSTLNEFVKLAFIGIGALLVVYEFFSNFKKITRSSTFILYIYVIVCLISSYMMREYGIIDNLKTIIWSLIAFGLLYTYSFDIKSDRYKKVMKIAFVILNIIWVVAIIISIKQYITGFSEFIKPEGYGIRKAQGFVYNRLFGIFVDPNYAAVTTNLLFISSIYLFSIEKSLLKRILIIINGTLQISYIVLSGSRTALVVLLASGVFGMWLILRNRFKNSKKFKREILSICLAIVTVCASYIAILGLKEGLEKVPSVFNRFNINQESLLNENKKQSINTKESTESANKKVEGNKGAKTASLDRTDLEGKGITNLRYELWRDSIEIYKSKMWFGTSPRNFTNYAKENFKGTYPAKGYDCGNGYLSVLVYTGLVGAAVIFIFIIIVIRNTGKYIFKFQYIDDCKFNVLSLVIVLMIGITAMINQEIFLINSINTAIFWLSLGYIMVNSNKRRDIDEDSLKEKVGIVTIHDADNYGSALQAYATQEILDELGYNGILINHKCKKISNEYGIKRILDQKSIKAMLETIIRSTILIPSRIKFKNFRENYFKQVEEKELCQNDYNKFLVGSDQVWNYKITGFDKAYFLDFVSKNEKKIAFSSSFGITEIPEILKKDYITLLNDFSNIAVREGQAASLIKQLTGKDVQVVLDPTLLIKKDNWYKIMNNKVKSEGYILCYQIAHSETLVQFANSLSEKTGKKIISIQGSLRHRFNAKYIWNAGPSEYIELIKNADYVITNSFHGTAFSINFNKNFFTELLPSFEKTSSRLEDILDMFELRNRQIINGGNDNMLEDINYTKVNNKLEIKREESIKVLKDFIEG